MKFSEFFIPTLRDAPSDAEIVSHRLMLQAGYIRKLSSGIYNFLPLSVRVIKKIEAIVREELNKIGAIELLMPMVLPASLWKETGRWDIYGKELLRLNDRHDNEFCLGPTHEEVITDIVRKEINSYKMLPVSFYQIQTKFRDEIRPRFGLMRGREFIMKDCYSFDVDEENAIKTYWKYYEAYKQIFNRCGLNFKAVEATSGMIGGELSHEFQVLADTGEDEIFGCTHCEFASNREKLADENIKECPKCEKGELKSYRGIEVGHVFHLGDKYSKSMNADYLDQSGKKQIMSMGCYGIGITRVAAAAIEQNHDEKGIIWPAPIAPFLVELIHLGQDDEVLGFVKNIYQDLSNFGLDVLWDDRDQRAGVKFNDADLIGIPWQIIIGKKSLASNSVEIKDRATGVSSMINIDELNQFVREKILIF
jgi:prolyl-tRNA synthetase